MGHLGKGQGKVLGTLNQFFQSSWIELWDPAPLPALNPEPTLSGNQDPGHPCEDSELQGPASSLRFRMQGQGSASFSCRWQFSHSFSEDPHLPLHLFQSFSIEPKAESQETSGPESLPGRERQKMKALSTAHGFSGESAVCLARPSVSAAHGRVSHSHPFQVSLIFSIFGDKISV